MIELLKGLVNPCLNFRHDSREMQRARMNQNKEIKEVNEVIIFDYEKSINPNRPF